MGNSIIINLSLVVGKQITLHKKTCSFFFQTLNMWTLEQASRFRIYFGRFCHVSGDSVTLWYAILSQVRLYSKTSIKQTPQLSGHPLLQLVSVLCVDPDFVGHDSTAWFDRHDSTERLPSLTQRSMKSRNHERRLEVVSDISPTFIREIERKLREQWL